MVLCCPPEMVAQCRSFLEDEFFKAFVDESRQNILLLLLEQGEMTVNDISARIAINQSNVSRHLSLLYRTGVATRRKTGREAYYQLDYENIAKRLGALLGIVHHCCPPAPNQEA